MNKESNNNQDKILYSGNVIRATSSNAFGVLLIFAFLAIVLAGILFAKSKVNRSPLSTSEEAAMYISVFVFIVFLLLMIHLRLRLNVSLTIIKSADGIIVVTVNDPNDPKTIEGPFQIHHFYFKKIAHTEPIKIVNHLRLVIKKEHRCFFVLHEEYEDFKNTPIGWTEIAFDDHIELYGDAEDRQVDYFVAEGDKKVCEQLIDVFLFECDEIELLNE